MDKVSTSHYGRIIPGIADTDGWDFTQIKESLKYPERIKELPIDRSAFQSLPNKSVFLRSNR